uniref:leucine-rich repeat domain-containing protein n=1 Tax=Ruminococcus sp. TaxID=41978 RepID=UPI0025F79188
MKIRKILVMALALTFVNGVTAPFAAEMPCHSFAANVEDTDDIGKLGDNVTWSLNDEGTLTISGKGTISDYNDGDTPFADNSQIKKVIIEEGITHIGNYVFSSCHNIQSIELPGSLTGIGEYVFENCTSL